MDDPASLRDPRCSPWMIEDLSFKRAIRSPNGEDVLYTFHQLLKTRAADFDSILAAVYGYLLIAVGFGLTYAAIDAYVPGALSVGDGGETLSTYIYFSLVTMTTLGYGDLQPLGWARVFAALEALLGYLHLGIIVGLTVALVSTGASQGGDDP